MLFIYLIYIKAQFCTNIVKIPNKNAPPLRFLGFYAERAKISAYRAHIAGKYAIEYATFLFLYEKS